jgi:hypothetical protein
VTRGIRVEFEDVEEPPPSGDIEINRRAVNLASVLLFDGFHRSSRYERYQRLQELTGSTAEIKFRLFDLASGGVELPIPAGVYELLVDDVVQTSVTMPGGTTLGTFTLDITGLDDGWRILDIVRVALPSQSAAQWAVFVNKAGGTVAAQDEIPVMTGSYDLSHSLVDHMWAWVPSTFDPAEHPLPDRTCPSFSTADAATTFYRTNMVMDRKENIHRTSVNTRGIRTTFNNQNYEFGDMVREYPTFHLLDGPRGVGTLMMPTHIMVDRHGGAYCLDPWRVVRVGSDGTVTTRCGYRHYEPPHNYGEVPRVPEDMELLGDWSAIPLERRGFHELWGGAFDLLTVAFANLDTGAPQQLNSVNGELEHPHSVGPRLFVADSQRNRICLLTFTRDSFTAEPVVTEFLPGLLDPWDVVWSPGTEEGLSTGVLYISERTGHKITCYNAVTGAFIRTVVSGLPLATVTDNRFVVRTAPLDTIRLEDVVAPEGLYLQGGYLYYGSMAMGEVRRVHLTTGVIEVMCRPTISLELSHFVKIAVSDGTFGPLGTIFTVTFSNQSSFPQAFLPNTGPAGTSWAYRGDVPFLMSGKGGWRSLGYPTAVGVGNGRMYCGSTQEGLVRISKVQTGDPTANETKYNSGANEWKERGYRVVYGDEGFGYQSLPLPWGVHEDIDYFLAWNGHVEDFKSVTQVSSASFPPTFSPTGQRVEMSLHASGGGTFTFGNRYEAVCTTEMSKNDDETFIFHTQDGSGSGTPDYLLLRPIDVAPDAGGTMETLWFGYAHGPGTETAHPYTEVKLDALYKWALSNNPQVNRNKVTLSGSSMGAWGGLSYGLRRPTMYAAIFVTLPRWRATTLADYETGFATPPPSGILMSDTGELFSDRMNMIDYVGDTENDIPFLAWAIGKNDGFSPFQDHIDAVAALRAANRAFVFSWNEGNHGAGIDAWPAVTATYSTANFELGVGYPIFSQSSRDNLLSEAVGGINLGFRWRTVVETANSWSCEISNSLGATTVTVRPFSSIYTGSGTAQTVVIPAGTWLAVSFS